MTTTTPTNTTRCLNLMMVVLVMLALAFAYASSLIHEHFANTPAPRNVTVTAPVTIRAAKPATLIRTDEGFPRAREDVFRTAIVGGGNGNGNGAATPVPLDENQLKISARATDSEMMAFLRRTNLQQLATVYNEMSQMIDTRHVNPPSYEERTRGAIQSVTYAIRNESFLRANNVNPNPQAIQSVEAQLRQVVGSQPARNANEAVGVMQVTAELVSRSLGIRREAVALEFVNGTLDSLDRYSSFMPSSAASRPGASLENVRTATLEENVVGIGVELKAHNMGVEIVDVIEGGPAAELGLRAGDIIIAINQQSMGGKTLNEVADRLVGSAGTPVTLDIDRNGSKFRGTVVRRKFYVSSVTGTKLLDNQSKVGYVRMKQFSSSTAEDLEKALFNLHNQGMQGLVVDLRGNPGGLLDECIDVSNMFLPSGVIVSTKGKNASDNSVERAKAGNTWAVPMVVLVDENSASASEIFAAAIQENLRGVVVGRKSYGKGTVQTHFPMRTVSATLKLTTANFYSPNGRTMAGAGVTPDIQVNASANGTRGTTNDSDLQMAMRVFAEGTPTNLAARFGGRSDNPFRSLQTAPLTNNMPQAPYGNQYPNYNTNTNPNWVPNYNTNPNTNNNWAPNYNNTPVYPQHNNNWQLTDRGIVEY